MNSSPLNGGPSSYQKDRYKGSGTPYRSQVAELKAQAAANKLPRAVKLLATLRELSLYLTDYEVFDEEYVTVMAAAIPQMKDNDNDNRKALRLLYHHVTEVLTALAARGQLAPQKILDIYEIILSDIGGPASNVSHRHLAVRTAGVLAQLASSNGGQQAVKKFTKVIEEPVLKLSAMASSSRPQTKKKSALKEYQDQCFISSAYGCCLRRLPLCPPTWLGHTLSLCCMDNDDTARHAFADADDIENLAVGLHKKLRPTNSEHGATYLNVRDPLACIYYLRVCRILAFHPTTIKVNDSIRDEFYRTIVKSICDPRLRVSLEAIRCLFSNGLESYNRMVAMENKLHVSLVHQAVSTLVTAMAPYQNPEGSLSPALHSILRVVLVVAATLCHGVQAAIAAANAVEPPKEEQTPRSLNDTMAFLDIFHRPAPTTPTPNLMMQPPPPSPYQEEMKNLVRVIHSAGLLECRSPYISTTGLCAVMWLAPNPDSPPPPMMATSSPPGMDNPKDAWRTIHRLALKAVRYCPDDLLREILDVLQARAELQPALAPTLLPMIFNIAEHFFHKAPGDAMGALILQTWQAILDRHQTVAPYLVLESAFRILDYNHGQTNAVLKNPVGSDSMVRAASVWAIHGAEAPSLSQARSALTRVKRLAAWFLGQYITKLMPEQVPAVFMRLKTLAIFGDYHTRCVAVTALCRAALVLESLDLKMDVYEFLHSLEVAEFDLSICPDVKEEMTSLSEVQGHAVDYLDQGGGLCLKDIISPVMACLDKHFEAVQAGRDTATLPLDTTLKDLLTIQDD